MSTSTVRVVCRPALAPGFGLAGVEATPAGPDFDLMAALDQASRDPQVGVVLVEEALYDRVPIEARARLDRQARPVVVPFPGASWDRERPAEDRVVALLRRAIGYRVRIS